MSGTKYPNHIDSNTELPLSTDNVTAVKAQVVNDLRSAILAIEQELGVDPSREYGSVRARLDAIKATLDAVTGAVGSPIGPVGGDLSGSLPNPAVVDLTISGQTQGSILYFNGTNWIQLSPSTAGYVLTTHGTGANPTWDPSASLTASAPIDVTKSAAVVGIATSAARADHKHNISTAAPSNIGNANTEGSATSLARSDHIHALAGTVGGDLSGTLPNPQVNKLTIAGQTQGSILYYNGTAWVQLSPGADGYVLTTHSAGQNPTWTAISNIIATNYLTISDWYVNISTGSDTNDGLTSLTPLKTIEELSNRLCPNGDVAFLKQTTTIHVAAGTYGNPYFNIGSGSLIISCTPTLSSNLTLNAVTNTVASTSTRGEIEVASGTFVDYSRIRITGGAQIGALAFSTGLNLFVNKTFTSAFLNPSGSQVNLNIGDTVAIETLNVTFGRAIFISTNSNYSITVNNAILSDCNCTPSTNLNNCNIINAIIVGGALITFCSISNSTIGYGNYTGYGNQFLGTSTSNFGEFNFSSTNVFDDCNNFFGQDVGFNFVNIELINRVNSIGLIFNINSKVNVSGYLWSGTGAYSTAVVQMKSGSYFSFTNLPSIPGASNIIIAGVNFNWSQLPQSVGETTAEFNTTYTSAANDISYWTGNYWKRLPAGTDGYVLTTHSTSSPPTWSLPNSAQTLNGYVANWYVNALTGNDDNDGKSSITAFRTTEKLSQTLCPGGAKLIINQNTAINIAAGSYNSLELNLSIPVGSNYTFDIYGSFTSSAPITLSSVTDTVGSPASPVRGRIQTASGTFVDKGRIRSTSGVNAGAITYCTGLTSSTDAWVKEWWSEANFSTVNIANGTTCVVDTLTASITRVRIQMVGNPIGGIIAFHDLILLRGVEWVNTVGGSAGLLALQCQIGGTSAIAKIYGNSQCHGCRLIGPAQIGFGAPQQPVLWGCVIETQLITITSVNIIKSCFNGGSLIVGADQINSASPGMINISRVEWVNGTGTAIAVFSGGSLNILDQQFGFGSSYAVGIALSVGAQVITNSTSYLNIPAIQQITMVGYNYNYSEIPISLPGYNAYILNSAASNNIVNDGYYGFLPTVTNPQIFQLPNLTSISAVGKTFTVLSQSMVGTNTRGGTLALSSGTGNPNNPTFNASDGYITISRGNNLVASWTDGYSDFISFGSKFNPSALTGNVRLPNNGIIASAGNVSLKASNISLLNTAISYQNMSGGLYISESTISPTGNPTSGFFVYQDSVTHKPYIRNQLGLVSSLSFSGITQTVTNNAARDAIPALERIEGMKAYVQLTQCTYILAADLTTWIFETSSPNLSSQTVWYVDPAGNDNNDGKTAGTAIATLNELSNRLFPNGRKMILNNDVTININTISLSSSLADYSEFTINVGTNEALTSSITGYTLNIICGITSSSPITLTSHVQPNGLTSTRGQLATASGTFVYQERIRITSGTAIGAICYSTGLNGNAQTTYVSTLSIPTIAGSLANGGHGATLIPVAGDTCVVDTLVTFIRRLTIISTGYARVFVQDAKIVRASINGTSLNTPFSGIGGPVFLAGCQQISVQGRWECNSGGASLLACRTVSTSKTALMGNGWCIIEHAIQGTLSIASGFTASYGLTIDAGKLIVGVGDNYDHPGQCTYSKLLVFTSATNSFIGGGIEVENGNNTIDNSAAITVYDNSTLYVTDFNTYLWGASAPYGFGIKVTSNGYVLQGNVAPGVFASIYKIPSIINLVIANLYFTYSDNPISIPNQNCGLIEGSYLANNDYNQTDGYIHLINQSGNKSAPQNFSSSSGLIKSGLYEVYGYISTTTTDAAATGTPTINILYTDTSGTVQTTPIATSPSLTTLGGAGGQAIIENTYPYVINWSITGITNAGNSKYSIRLKISKISWGG